MERKRMIKRGTESAGETAEIGDAVLIRNYLAGDERAFESLYFRYRKMLYGFLNNLMREQLADVDEIFEETWLKVIDSLPGYRDDGKFSAWLFRIARNKCFDRFRSVSRKGEVALSEEVINVTIDENLADPGLELNRQDLQGIISEAMADLSPEQREVFMLRQNDISFKDISAIQRCSLNTVLSRMQYAVKNLRRALEKAGLDKKNW